ncbi:MAG: hypothetical protein ABJB16_16835 [Saprospiraceae bacterium]
MKKLFLSLNIIVILSGYARSQTTPPAVSNVVTQVSDDRDKVTVTYDLARRSGIPNYNIAVKIILDGEVVTAQALSGDVGPNITPGYGKRIVWDVMKDLSELSGSLKIEVSSKTNAPDCIPMKMIPVYAGLSGVAATGAALVLSGLKSESDSKDLYTVYKNNLDPNASVFSETTREQFYLDANSKHKKGTWLTAGGGTVIIAGGVVMVMRLIQISKYNKKCAGKTTDATPKWNIKPIVDVGSGNAVSAGIAINF